MNRYLLEGLIRDLHAGKTIVVIAPNMAQSRHAFMAVTIELEGDDSVAKITRGNGREYIEMRNGARLRTIAANCNGGRGFSASDSRLHVSWGTRKSAPQQDVRAILPSI